MADESDKGNSDKSGFGLTHIKKGVVGWKAANLVKALQLLMSNEETERVGGVEALAKYIFENMGADPTSALWFACCPLAYRTVSGMLKVPDGLAMIAARHKKKEELSKSSHVQLARDVRQPSTTLYQSARMLQRH